MSERKLNDSRMRPEKTRRISLVIFWTGLFVVILASILPSLHSSENLLSLKGIVLMVLLGLLPGLAVSHYLYDRNDRMAKRRSLVAAGMVGLVIWVFSGNVLAGIIFGVACVTTVGFTMLLREIGG